MKQVWKRALALTMSVIIFVLSGMVSVAKSQTGNDVLKFNEDGKFVVMQVADPQDNQNPRKAMLDMLAAAYDQVRPDLVVFSGDNMLGRIAENKSDEKKMAIVETALDAILKPLEDRGIPFAVTFGNHDDQCGISKEEQITIYRRYTNCIGFNDENPAIGRSTYNLPILSADATRIAYNLWLVESAGKNEQGEYFEHVSPEVLDWYVQTSNALKTQNGGEPIYSLMFQHIPVPEIYELLTEVSKGIKGAVEKDGKYYVLNTEKANGFLGEGPCVTQENYGQLDVVAAQGDVSALVFGHDHVNSFVGTLRGVDLVQTPGASFRSYGNHLRGVRVFTIDENDPETYVTETLSYYDLMGTGTKAKLQFIFNADEKIPLRILICLFPIAILFLK